MRPRTLSLSKGRKIADKLRDLFYSAFIDCAFTLGFR